MFCPTCGRDNPSERKFCSSCGTNLEAISQMLSGETTDFFTKMDTSLDQFIARYAEHVFKNAQSNAADRKVSNSWKLLGKGLATSLVDVFVAIILLNFFTVRFHILWISTPFRLLSERNRRHKAPSEIVQAPAELPKPAEGEWLPGPVSVSEHTTERLQDYLPRHREHPPTRD
jgi:zinc ribbon protein